MKPRFAFAAQVFMCLTLTGLASCGAARDSGTASGMTSDATSSAVASSFDIQASTSDSSTSTSGAVELISCAQEVGETAAQNRVKACIAVSPATHSPCSTANSCAMIDSEIFRSCDLLNGAGTLPAQCQPAPRSQAAAAAIITRYFDALNAHDYATAWQQWGDNGAPDQTLAQFTAGFAQTRSTHVTIGALPASEGAAGSIYQTIPVTVDATLNDGTRQRFTGEYVIRRVNGVDGATADQLRWHISSAKLTATSLS